MKCIIDNKITFQCLSTLDRNVFYTALDFPAWKTIWFDVYYRGNSWDPSCDAIQAEVNTRDLVSWKC